MKNMNLNMNLNNLTLNVINTLCIRNIGLGSLDYLS